MSHAGSGTLLGALSYGLPQVCVPQAADQLRNARAIQDAGAGVCVFPDELTVEEMAQAIDTAMTSPDVQANARRIADEIAALPSPAAVAGTMEALAGRAQ